MMNELNGTTLSVCIMVVVVLACGIEWLLYRRKHGTTNALDALYNRIVLRNILPSNQGIPIDEVMKNLEGEDMSGFHLSSQGNGGAASQ